MACKLQARRAELMSFNTYKKPQREFIKCLNANYRGFIISLQEVGNWRAKTFRSIGFRKGILPDVKCTVGFVIPRAFYHPTILTNEQYFQHFAGITIGTCIIVNFHLIDADKPGAPLSHLAIEQGRGYIARERTRLRAQGWIPSVCVCGDLNLALTPSIPNFTGPLILPKPSPKSAAYNCTSLSGLRLKNWSQSPLLAADLVCPPGRGKAGWRIRRALSTIF